MHPPNSGVCTYDQDAWSDGNYSASSNHPGGAHVLMADGAVKFITDSIEAGNKRFNANNLIAGQQSPYGLWGALGTRANSEVIEEEL